MEIKASEGEHVETGEYYLEPAASVPAGIIIAICNMETGGESFPRVSHSPASCLSDSFSYCDHATPLPPKKRALHHDTKNGCGGGDPSSNPVLSVSCGSSGLSLLLVLALGTGHYLSPGGGAEYFCCYTVEIT